VTSEGEQFVEYLKEHIVYKSDVAVVSVMTRKSSALQVIDQCVSSTRTGCISIAESRSQHTE
jgi:hypothetical protein